MAHISEHHSEEEGEGDGGEDGGVYLGVARNTIGVGDLLGNTRVAVGVEGCRRLAGLELLQFGGRDYGGYLGDQSFFFCSREVEIGDDEVLTQLHLVE